MTPTELLEIGLDYERRGKMDEAVASYSRIVVLWPQEIEPYHRLSVLALQNGNQQVALEWIEKGLAINENIVELWNNRALALAELACFDEANEAFNRSIMLRPENWEAFYNLGRMLFIQKKYAESEAPLRRAAELDPNSALTFNNLGLALHELFRYDEARAAFGKAIELKPDFAEATSNLGATLYYSHNFAEAEAWLRKAIELTSAGNAVQSDEQTLLEAGSHYNLASLLMCQGDLLNGFEEYERRWKTKNWPKLRQYPGRPLWTRSASSNSSPPVSGKTLFVWHEQGLGDTIHFIRFLHELAKQDCQIVAEVQPELYRLVAGSLTIPGVTFLRPGENPPSFDMHLPLLSLPRMLGVTYENLPAFKPYLRPRGGEIEDWRGRLKSMTPVESRKKRKIGLVWAGNPAHPADRNRSMSWETIAPLVEAHRNRCQFYSLQVGNQRAGSSDVIELGSALTDFAVTAAVITNLELIIAVDTSIVHLAGALGKRVWTMLFNTPDWRWRMDENGIGEKTTKWYPSMSLFWQKKPGVWEDVIEQVSGMLALI